MIFFLKISLAYEQELHSTLLLKSQFHQMSQNCDNCPLRVKMVCNCVCRQREREYIPITIALTCLLATWIDMINIIKECGISNGVVAVVD